MPNKNNIVLKHHVPYIQTTPDESIPFVLLERGSISYNKFVMENFISFRLYDYQDRVKGSYYLRFENYLYWDTFDGFDSLAVPVDVLDGYDYCIQLIVQIIQKEYFILMFVNRRYIKFYNWHEDDSHRLIIYGVNIDERFFFCTDFLGGEFREFKVTFKEMDESISHYQCNTLERNGLFAIRVSDKCKPISYLKLYNGLCHLEPEFESKDINSDGIYGLSALKYNLDNFVIESLYEGKYDVTYMWLNFVRESCKLMKERLLYIQGNDNLAVATFGLSEKKFEMLWDLTNSIFLTVLKIKIGGSCIEKYNMHLVKELYMVLEKYKDFVLTFKKDIYINLLS